MTCPYILFFICLHLEFLCCELGEEDLVLFFSTWLTNNFISDIGEKNLSLLHILEFTPLFSCGSLSVTWLFWSCVLCCLSPA